MSGALDPASIATMGDPNPQPPSQGRNAGSARSLAATGAIFLLAAVGFVLLRSRDFTAVDGAVRCLEVFYRGELFFHRNNHLLYPVYVLLWHRALGSWGLAAGTPLEYLSLTQALNALAAAGCCAVVFQLALRLGGSLRAAVATTILFASTRAFLLHATNSAEPMIGLFWSLVAVLVLVVARGGSSWLAPLAAGGLLALAAASYQTMLLLAPALAALCWLAAPSAAAGARRLLALFLTTLVSAAAIFGWAYHQQGITSLSAKTQTLLAQPINLGVFASGSLRSLLLLPLGLAHAITRVLPADFDGLRSLLRAGPIQGAAAAISWGTALLLMLAIAVRVRALRRAPVWSRDLAVAALALGGATTLIAPFLLDPLYDKLWLQPLACAAVVLGATVLERPWRPLTALLVVLVGGVATLNLTAAVRAARQPTPYLQPAATIARMTDGRDLVVHDWDRISVLFGTIWGWDPRRHRFDFPTTAVELGPGARAALDHAVEDALRRGGRVLFIGVIDQPPEQWRVFLGNRTKVSYEALDPYRRRAQVIARFPYGRSIVHLSEWRTPHPEPPGRH